MAFLFHIPNEHERFVRRYMPMHRSMFAMAFRLMQNEEDAEDVVQDVLLTLYERRDYLPPEAVEQSYVVAMVRNRCIDLLRAPQTQSLAPPDDDDDPSSNSEHTSHIPEPTTPSSEAQLEAHDYLTHLLAKLPDRTRQLVKLRLVDGLSFDEIAERTGITAVNARVILSRTLKELQNQQDL